MKHLFARTGISKLREFSRAKVLLAFDFDGTLAPITDSPGEARLKKTTDSLLRHLAGRYPVAVLSGRSVGDLKERVPLGFQAYVGNHGLEGIPESETSYGRAQRESDGWAEELNRHLATAGFDDVLLEHKRYSLALHYRRSRQPYLRHEQLLNLCSRLVPPPRILPGKLVINLLPSGLPNKGDALRFLLREYERGIYIGDDDTDEDAFRLRLPNLLSISVGRRRGSSAEYYVRDQTEVQRLLRTLLRLRP